MCVGWGCCITQDNLFHPVAVICTRYFHLLMSIMNLLLSRGALVIPENQPRVLQKRRRQSWAEKMLVLVGVGVDQFEVTKRILGNVYGRPALGCCETVVTLLEIENVLRVTFRSSLPHLCSVLCRTQHRNDILDFCVLIRSSASAKVTNCCCFTEILSSLCVVLSQLFLSLCLLLPPVS